MARAADRFPENDLIQVLAAEAAMDTQPWDYWQPGGREPKGRAGDAIARIETVLARSPNNAGAIHLYIHLAEASSDPWRSEAAAERLGAAAPQAGHLVHMPGHIYYRVGRFRDSIRANIEAVAADEAYIRSADPSPIYRYGYYPHNVHFVMTSAAMGGDGRMALEYADRLDQSVPMEMAQAVALAQPVKAAPWFARAQFAEPPRGKCVIHQAGPLRLATGMADVHHDDLTHLVPGEQLATSQATKRDGECRAMRAMRDARPEVYTAGTVDRHDRQVEVRHALEQRRGRGTRCTGGAGAENGIDH